MEGKPDYSLNNLFAEAWNSMPNNPKIDIVKGVSISEITNLANISITEPSKSQEVIPLDIDGKPVRSLYLKPKTEKEVLPSNLNKDDLHRNIMEKRAKYFADPSIIEPLEYTEDEVTYLKHFCETDDRFYPLAHINFSNYGLSLDARLINFKTKHITRGSRKGVGRMTFHLSQDKKQTYIDVNILMAKAFLGPPPTSEHKTVDHMDIDETNDYWYNLRWATGVQQARNKNKEKAKERVKRGRAVTQIDPHTGLEIFTWFRIKDAGIALGLGSKGGNISTAAKSGGISGGFRWRYADNLMIDRDGNLEQWKAVDWPDYGEIWTSNMGRVLSKDAGFWFGSTTPNGRKYIWVKLNSGIGQSIAVSRLVILAFKGPSLDPLKQDVDHVDGKRNGFRNNCIWNLEYVSVGENNLRAYETGLRKAPRQENMKTPIVQLTLDGRFIKEYAGLNDTERETGFLASNLRSAASGNSHTSNGYRWMYSKDYFKGNSLYE